VGPALAAAGFVVGTNAAEPGIPWPKTMHGPVKHASETAKANFDFIAGSSFDCYWSKRIVKASSRNDDATTGQLGVYLYA
jgi:hypothetical protein